MTASAAPEPSEFRLPVYDTTPPSLLRRVARVWEYRELLVSLTKREVKVRYKDSFLGFIWTLLNPLLYLVVFSIVFSSFLRANVPLYGVFLLSGLMAWNLFSVGLGSATTSITGNGSLVQKVWFPREILPLSAVASAFVTFLFQFVTLLLALVAFQRSPEWKFIPLLIPALLVTLLWATALGIVLSALNVHFRDVQHFLELLLLAWFWLTPIVYQFDLVGDKMIEKFGSDQWAMLNPLVPVVITMQRVIYNPAHAIGSEAAGGFDLMYRSGFWYLGNLAASGAVAVVILVVGLRVFGKLEANLGEEL